MFERFSILHILRRRHRSTGVHPYCPYIAMRADPHEHRPERAALDRDAARRRRPRVRAAVRPERRHWRITRQDEDSGGEI